MGKLPFPANWTMRETAHLNGGTQWFGYQHTCVQEPRLSRLDHYIRKDRSVASIWFVDGIKVADADAALAALQLPPAITDEELAALATIPDEPTHWTNRAAEVLRTLRDKGMVQWGPPAHLSRTEAGRTALSQGDGHG